MPSNVEPLGRPEALEGCTYKIKWPENEHALYVTINDALWEGRRLPFEVFINSKNMDHYAWTLALTRMISAVFRRGGDVRFVAEELRAVFDPRGGAWMNGRYVPSILAMLGDVIERHLNAVGYDGADVHVRSPDDPPGVPRGQGDRRLGFLFGMWQSRRSHRRRLPGLPGLRPFEMQLS